MKPLLVLARITFVGCLWSIIFIEGIRVIMLENWRFDIFWPPHWLHAWNLWSAGWVIDTPKEWAFILIIATFVPLWLTGWIALSLIPWENIFYKLIVFPINLLYSIFNPLKIATKTPVVIKKRSYKEIRPTGPRVPIYDYTDNTMPASSVRSSVPVPSVPKVTANAAPNNHIKEKAATARETFSHALFNLDDEDDDFDLDFGSFEKSDIFSIGDKDKKNKDEASQQAAPKTTATFEAEDDEDVRDDDIFDESPVRYEDDDRRQQRRRFEDDEDDDRRQQRGPQNERERPSRKADSSKTDYREKRRSRDENRFDDQRENYDTRDNRRNENSRDNNRNRQETFSGKNNRNTTESVPQRSNPVADILQQKGYDIISGITVKNVMIDFVAVSGDRICLCLIDKEPGDWLADEERFNDEEPLWFSENSHRISPVRKIDKARDALSVKLSDNSLNFEISAYVIIQIGNIINAEDMFEIWNNMNVEVTRINRGSPKEIKLFSRSIEEANEKLEKTEFETLRKLIRNIA